MDKIKASVISDLSYQSRWRPKVRTVTVAPLFTADSVQSLSNFPVLVKTDSTFHLGTATGYDVRFLSGTTELPFELDFYDSTTGKGAWWVCVPSISASSSLTFTMYYSDPTANTNNSSPSTVWNGYDYVYHFNNLSDFSSVVGSYTPSQEGSVAASLSLVANPFTGCGMRFLISSGYGSTNYQLSIANAISTTTGTISAFASTDIVGRSDRSMYFDTGWKKFRFSVSGNAFDTAAGNATDSMTRAAAGGIFCYGGSTSTSQVNFVVNGVKKSTSSATAGQMRWDSPRWVGTGYNVNQPTELIIDEMRISTTVCKPAEWFMAEQNMMMNYSNYITFGSERYI